MAQITPDMISEMRNYRGMGLSLKKIAALLSKKHSIEVSHQTISYHLGKVKKEMLEGKKSVRIIRVESMTPGPRVFVLDPVSFEKERKNNTVYQHNNLVYELRTGCMHCTTLPAEANAVTGYESYTDWASIFLVGADPGLPRQYQRLTNVTESGIQAAFHNHKTNQGTVWLRSNGYNQQIFQKEEHVSNRISKLLEEYYQLTGNEAVSLSGNTAKDTLTLHSIYGSVENMGAQLKNFIRPDANWWNDHIQKAFNQYMKETGIPPSRRKRALAEGCLDNKKLSLYFDGKFKDWNRFESAIQIGFYSEKEYSGALTLQCQDKKEYDAVKKHNWPNGPYMRHALGSGFKHKEASLWAVLRQKSLLGNPDVVKWIRKDPSELDRIEQFPSLKALQLYDAILGGVYKSNLVVTQKILEKYNSMPFPGPAFQRINQIEMLLIEPLFSDICEVDVEAGSVILNVKSGKNKKNKKENPAIDLEPYENLRKSKSKYALAIMKRVNERDLDDATASAWRWLFMHGKNLLPDPRAPRFAETMCNELGNHLELSKKENSDLHYLRRARNDFDKANEQGTVIKPKWHLIENCLNITEKLINSN